MNFYSRFNDYLNQPEFSSTNDVLTNSWSWQRLNAEELGQLDIAGYQSEMSA